MKWSLFLLLFVITACQSQDDLTTLSGSRMTISWEVKIAEKLDHKQRLEALEAIETVFEKVDSIYNNWNPHSEISRLNQLKAKEKTELSIELADFLYHVGELVAFTEGRFDPTVGPLQKLYKSSFMISLTPDPFRVAELERCVGWDKIHLEGRSFWKEQDEMTIDLCGVAKGYGVDLITEALLALGHKGIYVEWGGEIKCIGSHKDGTPWRIAIVGGEQLEMKNEAIATSGNYYQRWTVEGITYTHIIDPKERKPLRVSESTIPSTAVRGLSCADSDAIATALMLFPSADEARYWIAERGLSAWIIE